MRRRDFVTILGGASATLPFAAVAQQAGRIYRYGILAPFSCEGAPVIVALSDEIRRRGFINGQNLTNVCREFGSNIELASEYAGELVKAKVDVIVAYGDVAVRAAQQATKTIPILAMTDDMVGSGLVNSLARPNGNTTGISILAAELDGKRQEILIEAVPGIRRMAALTDANNPATKLEALQEAARVQNVELSIYRIARGEDVAAAIDMAKTSGATALNILASPFLWTVRQLIMDRAAALRLPAIWQWPINAEEGGFAAYGPSADQISRDITARQLVQLFHGIKIADIPVEQPTKFELVINLKTANAMGITVPPALLLRADKVIE
jgi:putative tryptophan/tyrosine transport system substrate-binding protein